MAVTEHIAHVVFKPNCGLENTRAALIMRRIKPLCKTVSCYPPDVKSDMDTIPYLRDNGLYLSFSCSQPEHVLLAITASYFVDSCSLVEDASTIPPFTATGDSAAQGLILEDAPDRRRAPDSHRRRLNEREIIHGITEQLAETHHDLKQHLVETGGNRQLESISFELAKTISELRNAIAKAHSESFDGIVPPLKQLVEEYSQRMDVVAELAAENIHMELDNATLDSIEEVLRRAVRVFLQGGIEPPTKRIAEGKPPRATITLQVENLGSEVVCNIGHDGYPFYAGSIARMAHERGLLTRAPESYTVEEIGQLMLLPRFAGEELSHADPSLVGIGEISSILYRLGGHGTLRPGADGQGAELELHFPVPFTVLEVAQFRIGAHSFTLPVRQLERFEAFVPTRISGNDRSMQDALNGDAPTAVEHNVVYLSENGVRARLLNLPGAASPIAPTDPTVVVLLNAYGETFALLVDEAGGYERTSIMRLPLLLNRTDLHGLGCMGYCILDNDSICPVMNVRQLVQPLSSTETAVAARTTLATLVHPDTPPPGARRKATLGIKGFPAAASTGASDTAGQQAVKRGEQSNA